MKKQYLIGLLGFVTIFVPLANSLLTTNSKLFNSTYTNNEIQNEFIINDQNSQVIVKDLDHDGKASQGDQIDQIQFSINSNNFYPLYKDEVKNISSNEYGLNIYTKNSTDTIKPFYSISYNKINNLNQTQEIEFLNFNFNSIDNPTWEIWDAKLPDNSQEFIITAEKQENNHQEKIIENNIGEIPITPTLNDQVDPEIINPIVVVREEYFGNPKADFSYEVDRGNTGNNTIPGLKQQYTLTKIKIINEIDDENLYEEENPPQGEENPHNIILELIPDKDYHLIMYATFVDPNNEEDEYFYTIDEDIEGGEFHTSGSEDSIPLPPAPSNSNTMIMIGIIIGSILSLIIISFIGYYLYKKNK